MKSSLIYYSAISIFFFLVRDLKKSSFSTGRDVSNSRLTKKETARGST